MMGRRHKFGFDAVSVKVLAFVALCLAAIPIVAQPPNISPAQPKLTLPVQEKVDLSTPVLAVKSFVAAWNRHDWEAALRCVADGKPETLKTMVPLIDDLRKSGSQIFISEPRIVLGGERTMLTMHAEMNGTSEPGKEPKAPQGPTRAGRVIVDSQNGEWRIRGNPMLLGGKPDKGQAPVVENNGLLTIMATMLSNPSLLEKMLNGPLTSMCQGHLKKLALAAIMLAEDHQQIFAIIQAAQKPNPEGMNDGLKALLNEPFQKALYPYAEDAKVFFCPLRSDDAENNEAQARRDKLMNDLGMPRTGEPYAFNTHLDGMALADINEVARTVLFYEGKDGKLSFRHGHKANVAFVDGHVKPIDENEAKQLIWKP